MVSSIWFPMGSVVTLWPPVPGLWMNTSWASAWSSSCRTPDGVTYIESGPVRLRLAELVSTGVVSTLSVVLSSVALTTAGNTLTLEPFDPGQPRRREHLDTPDGAERPGQHHVRRPAPLHRRRVAEPALEQRGPHPPGRGAGDDERRGRHLAHPAAPHRHVDAARPRVLRERLRLLGGRRPGGQGGVRRWPTREWTPVARPRSEQVRGEPAGLTGWTPCSGGGLLSSGRPPLAYSPPGSRDAENFIGRPGNADPGAGHAPKRRG